MIFVTVGTQLPFDRLVKSVDAWAGNNREEEIFAQVGPSKYKPQNFSFSEFVKPSEANRYFQQSELVVSHAGMGSILTALRFRKPILILPRLASLGEHRNEHQLATSKWLNGKPGVYVATADDEISALLDTRKTLTSGQMIDEYANPNFTTQIKSWIDQH